MGQTLLDNQNSGAEDGHLPRIVRLEIQMDHVTVVLNQLQRRQEELHAATMTRFDELRDRIDRVQLETQKRFEQSRLEAQQRFDQTQQRFDQMHQEALRRYDVATERMVHFERYVIDRLDRHDHNTTNRIDKLTYWIAGLALTNLATVVGMFIRLSGH